MFDTDSIVVRLGASIALSGFLCLMAALVMPVIQACLWLASGSWPRITLEDLWSDAGFTPVGQTGFADADKLLHAVFVQPLPFALVLLGLCLLLIGFFVAAALSPKGNRDIAVRS